MNIKSRQTLHSHYQPTKPLISSGTFQSWEKNVSHKNTAKKVRIRMHGCVCKAHKAVTYYLGDAVVHIAVQTKAIIQIKLYSRACPAVTAALSRPQTCTTSSLLRSHLAEPEPRASPRYFMYQIDCETIFIAWVCLLFFTYIHTYIIIVLSVERSLQPNTNRFCSVRYVSQHTHRNQPSPMAEYRTVIIIMCTTCGESNSGDGTFQQSRYPQWKNYY